MLPSPPSLVYLSRLSSHSSLSFFPWLAEGEVHYVLPVPRFCGWHSRFLLSIVDHPSERSYLCCFHSRTIQKLFSVFKWCEERKIKVSNTSLRLQVAKMDHLRKNINSVIIYSPQCCCFFLLWNIKEDIMKNAGNQTVSVPIDFHCMGGGNTMGVNGNQNHLLPAFFKISPLADNRKSNRVEWVWVKGKHWFPLYRQ